MKTTFLTAIFHRFLRRVGNDKTYFFLYGLLMPLAFAPFHMPGMAFVSLALVYWSLEKNTLSPYPWNTPSTGLGAFWCGFFYGLGYFGFGVSWVAVSMIRYGHFHPLLAVSTTGLFIGFISLYPAFFCLAFRVLNQMTGHLRHWRDFLKIPFFPFSNSEKGHNLTEIEPSPKISAVLRILLFASLWTLFEYARANLFSGFPWLLTGQSQIDSFFKSMLPVVGIFGTGFLTAASAACAVHCVVSHGLKRLKHVGGLSALILIPNLFHISPHIVPQQKPFSVAIVQGNIAMRDKWDETLFWRMLTQYQLAIKQLYGTKLIVLPESALPLPASYIQSILDDMSLEAKKRDTAIIIGIPDTMPNEDEYYYNTLTTLGHATGHYYKQHLVPFGEYIPHGFKRLIHLIDYPDDSLKQGSSNQALLKIHSQRVASLICYEVAFGELLRKQLPGAEFIVSISDNGWFGHSLAIYQHRQIAQVYSLMSQRYQVLANNDGLSSIIDYNGEIIAALPPWTSGILKSTVILNSTITPWVRYGEGPALWLSMAIVLLNRIRRYCTR